MKSIFILFVSFISNSEHRRQNMSQFAAFVDPSKKNEWNKVLQEVLSETSKTNPGCPISDAYADAWVKFQTQNWETEVRNGVGLSHDEYAKMDAGPDLTAIYRTRFGVVKKKSKRPSTPRKPNNYSIFLKQSMEEHKEEWKDLTSTEKFRLIADMWKEMTSEDKKKYDASNKDK